MEGAGHAHASRSVSSDEQYPGAVLTASGLWLGHRSKDNP